MSNDNHFTAQLQAWLDPLDEAAVECDGMSRIISALLTDSLIEHTVMGGLLIDMHKLNDPSVGHEEGCACTHWWIELPTGHVIDYRARMWMGQEAQHGVFLPDNSHFNYRAHEPVFFSDLGYPILSLMSGLDLESYPQFTALAHQPATNMRSSFR